MNFIQWPFIVWLINGLLGCLDYMGYMSMNTIAKISKIVIGICKEILWPLSKYFIRHLIRETEENFSQESKKFKLNISK
jgi:uncharacterized membrane protein